MEAINSVGGIDANWVLVGVTSLTAFLFWNQIKDMKENMKENFKQLNETLMDLREIVQIHDKEIAIIKARNEKDNE